MRVFTVFLGLLSAIVALNTIEIAKHVNSLGTTWKATERPIITNITRRLGAILPGDPNYLELPARTYVRSDGFMAEPIPESFDVRTAWPKCTNVTSLIRDQSNCGSCFAHSSVNSFNDRYCIATGDNTKLFSVADALACCTGLLKCAGSAGCNGGQPGAVLKFITTTGVVEGGLNGDTTTCEPYPFLSCAHHVDSDTLPSCTTLPDYKTPECSKTCEYGSVTYEKDKFFGKTSYSLKTEEDIQRDMMKYGSVSMSFTVYEDFETYSSGVYQRTSGSGKQLGGHAIKCLGFGIENGIKYWECANSWNTGWGNQGTFRILRGTDECGIESGVVAIQV